MITFKELQKAIEKVQGLADEARTAADQAHERSIAAAVEKEFARLLEGDLRLFPRPHQEKAKEQLAVEERQTRRPRAAIALYHLERAVEPFTVQVQQLKADAMQAPDLEEAYLRRSRAKAADSHAAGLISSNPDHYMRLHLLAVQQRLLWLTETASWSPRQWAEKYRQALADPTRLDAAGFIAFTEERLTNGWPGATPADEREVTVIHETMKLIAETREARVPAEIRDAEAVIVTVRRVAQRARDEYKILPINPELDPRAAELAAAVADA
jgi:hypothetical protein